MKRQQHSEAKGRKSEAMTAYLEPSWTRFIGPLLLYTSILLRTREASPITNNLLLLPPSLLLPSPHSRWTCHPQTPPSAISIPPRLQSLPSQPVPSGDLRPQHRYLLYLHLRLQDSDYHRQHPKPRRQKGEERSGANRHRAMSNISPVLARPPTPRLARPQVCADYLLPPHFGRAKCQKAQAHRHTVQVKQQLHHSFVRGQHVPPANRDQLQHRRCILPLCRLRFPGCHPSVRSW